MNRSGVLVMHKPAGLTSHDVIIKVRRLLQIKKIGHTGTLDPMVEGVLPLCIGRATKIVEYLQERPKTYIAEWTGGIATDTEDQSGEILAQVDEVYLTEEEVTRAFQGFIGTYLQTPPMYSAVKIEGKRLYDLARAGKVVERPARPVEIYNLEIIEMDLKPQYPIVKFKVSCSKGTYIRTLCVDIGQALHIPAHMSHLNRVETAGFTDRDTHTLEELEQAVYDGNWEQLLVPLEKALPFFPAVEVPPYMVRRIAQGQPIYPRFPLPQKIKEGSKVRIVSPDGKLLAIHLVIGQEEVWSKPEKILSTPE